ncbi:phosphatases II [Coprinopsis marcescibilis]|uniref:Phosphatases II n=1 Tax=Coprinopsis marcescibilis TaxID=230819 RepID=A0A5C3L1X5_COPMA|nr:phosphatases II [Coprinopsis marcescibilis]
MSLSSAIGVEEKREESRNSARNASRGSSKSKILSKAFRPTGAPAEQVEYYSVKVGSSKRNNHLNRYHNLEAYDRTRVIVTADGSTQNVQQNDAIRGGYLNASWVLEKYGHKWWIATQAPLPQTAHSFLGLLLQPVTPPGLLSSTSASTPTSPTTRVRTVVQLTQNVESGRTKAHAYFPNTVGKSLIVPAENGWQASPFKVTLLRQETVQEACCLRSTVAIVPIGHPPPLNIDTYEDAEFDENGDGQSGTEFGEQLDKRVIFTHLLYTSWPDHGVPEEQDRASLISFIQLADRLNRDTSLVTSPLQPHSVQPNLNPDPPIIVGCSAGVGRTGTFIALSSLLRSFGILPPPAHPGNPSPALEHSPLGPLPEEMKDDCVAHEIDSLREQRQRMVERPEQAILIYEMLMDVFTYQP